MINTPTEIENELKGFGIESIITLDSVYKTLSPVYVKKELRSYQQKFPWIYEDESGDCDDAAITAIFSELRKAARRNKAYRGYGIPVALLIVTIPATSRFSPDGKRSKHLTVLIKCSDGKWYIYEKTNDEVYDFQELLDNMDYSVLHFAML